MITRIKIDGFKSLLNAELFLGPFTCIVGANAVGKSNFFDAIIFLSHLADKTILEAAKSIRSEEQKHSNIRDIFFKSGEKQYNQILFEVDLLVPRSAEDDLGQVATTSTTSLRYKLVLRYNSGKDFLQSQPIEIVEESLSPMTRDDAKKSIGFSYNNEWYSSVVYGRKGTQLISTNGGKIKLHQDQGGGGGRATEFIPEKMPRTLLSTVNAETPTAFLVRQEFRSWQMLQFEPTSLRQASSFHEVLNAKIDNRGRNIPATLYKLSQNEEYDVCRQVLFLLRDLVGDIRRIYINRDEKRELLTLMVEFKNGLALPAQSLSDGTLRFLCLSVIQESNQSGLICMEEPENGINPQKIKAIVNLLQTLSLDPYMAIDNAQNPMRQVVINTHSSRLISIVPEDSLYMAVTKEKYDETLQTKVEYTAFTILPDTTKHKRYTNIPTTSLGDMLLYLDNEPEQWYKDIIDARVQTVNDNIRKRMTAVKNAVPEFGCEPELF